jgi:hypothetical protein
MNTTLICYIYTFFHIFYILNSNPSLVLYLVYILKVRVYIRARPAGALGGLGDRLRPSI